MSNTYVTATGLSVPAFGTIRSNLEASFIAAFGNDIDLSVGGAFGLIIDIMSKSISDAFLLGQEIYTARNPDEATDTSLDMIAAETGARRIDATGTRVEDVVMYGNEGTVIVLGKRIRQLDSNLTYSLEADTTITKTATQDIYLEPNDTTVGVVYTITIDTVDASYTVVTDDTITDIIAGLIASVTSGDPGNFITNGGTVTNVDNTYIRLTSIGTNFSVLWNSYMDLYKLGSAGNFVADETGANSCSANSLTVIATPMTGWDSVNNPSEGTTGRDVETNAEFRIRRAASIGAGSATEGAIKSKLLNTVEGVTAVSIVSNRTDTIDGDGRPPNSFEVTVEGGTDADVALSIWNNMPAGIRSYGTESENIIDSEGFTQTIYFTRPLTKYLHVKIRRTLYSEETYPADGDVAIKQAIVAWAVNEFELGTDVIYQRIAAPVYTVNGISSIEITVDVTDLPGDTPTLAASNITIAANTLVLADVSRITVETL